MNSDHIMLIAGLGGSTYIIGTFAVIIAIAAFLRLVLFQNTPKEYKHNPND